MRGVKGRHVPRDCKRCDWPAQKTRGRDLDSLTLGVLTSQLLVSIVIYGTNAFASVRVKEILSKAVLFVSFVMFCCYWLATCSIGMEPQSESASV